MVLRLLTAPCLWQGVAPQSSLKWTSNTMQGLCGRRGTSEVYHCPVIRDSSIFLASYTLLHLQEWQGKRVTTVFLWANRPAKHWESNTLSLEGATDDFSGAGFLNSPFVSLCVLYQKPTSWENQVLRRGMEIHLFLSIELPCITVGEGNSASFTKQNHKE